MKSKQLTAYLLLSALAVSLAACGAEAEQTQNAPAKESEAVTEPEAVKFADSLPGDLDFGGYRLRIFSGGKGSLAYTSEDSADYVSDLYYRRNSTMLERLNLDTEIRLDDDTPWDTFTADVKNSVLADSDDYDIVTGSNWYCTSFALDGLLRDLSDAPYLDITQSWWSEDYIMGMSYKGHYYFLSGPIEKSFLSDMCCTFANKNLWNSLYDENIHDMVRSGKWTLDTLNGYLTETYQDLNGDGKTDSGDRLGLVLASDFAAERIVFGAGISVAPADKDGVPQLAFTEDTAALTALWEKWYGIKTSKYIYEVKWDAELAPNTTTVALDIFKQGSLLFAIGFLKNTESELRDMKDDYAILPLPKLDESQKDYVSVLADQNYMTGIPRTAQDTAAEGAFAYLEACAAESERSVFPAYFENALKNKYIRDEDSVETINMLSKHSSEDFGALYLDLGFANFIRYEISGDNIASAIAKKSKTFQKKLTSMLEALENNS